MPPKLAIALALAVAMAALAIALRKPRGDSSAVSGRGAALEVVLGMLRFAAQPWFPWIAAAGTAINMFTIIFTAATVVIFLAAVLARPQSWRSTAVANAVGATAGSALLLLLLRSQGLELIEERFPTVFHSAAWAKTMRIMEGYGALGMVGVAALPLILHPIIAFGVISGMSDLRILAIILTGRTIKYLLMSYITTTAPSLLKYFGIKDALFELAKGHAGAGATGKDE